jgi:ABC-type Na+ efflux pump permease subunit
VTILPIVQRELLVAARGARLQRDRAIYAGIILAIVLGTFAAWYLIEGSRVSRRMMSLVAWQSFVWIVAFHITLIPLGPAARCIAGEKDRRTLDFLLGTPLSSAEIILGKLAACVVEFAMYVAAGLPVMLLLRVLGGIDVWVIFLAYAALCCLALFLTGMSIWISTGAPDARRAVCYSGLLVFAWLVLPMLISVLFPRFLPRVPSIVMTVNAWVYASSPMALVLRIAGGATRAGLIDAVARMSGLQLAAGAVFVLWSIARLRSAFRLSASGEKTGFVYRLIRPGWRFRTRPAVGDDPILWREMTTSRENLLTRMIGLLFVLGIYGTLGYFTFLFARPAFIELWHHGYVAGQSSPDRPEWNWLTRLFVPAYGPTAPVDVARKDLNSFLRSVTCLLVFLVTLMALGGSAEAVATERARGTWDSLIATSLSARDILRSKMLASVWRLRSTAATLLALWTLGLAAGAIHPLGYLTAVLVTAASCWFFLNIGMLASVKATDLAKAMNPSTGLYFLISFSVALVYLLPPRLGSVLWGAGSPPFVVLLSLASYRDFRDAVTHSAAPVLQSLNIHSGEGALAIVATCLVAIVVPALIGHCFWRYTVANFDRLVGRPWRKTSVTNGRVRARTARVEFAQLPSTVGRVRLPGPDGSGNASRTCDSGVRGTIVP